VPIVEKSTVPGGDSGACRENRNPTVAVYSTRRDARTCAKPISNVHIGTEARPPRALSHRQVIDAESIDRRRTPSTPGRLPARTTPSRRLAAMPG